MNLKKGDLFISIPLGEDIKIKVTSIDLANNEIDVEYTKGGVKNLDTWELQHCIWALERGEYRKVHEPLVFRSKHGQLENDGAYAEDEL